MKTSVALLIFRSDTGDKFSHLVRGVQMLRSFGDEAHVIGYGDVYEIDLGPRTALAASVWVETKLPRDRLLDICSDVEWSLGEDQDVHGANRPDVLDVDLAWYVELDDTAGERLEGEALRRDPAEEHRAVKRFLDAQRFEELCGFAQQQLREDEPDLMGDEPGLA